MRRLPTPAVPKRAIAKPAAGAGAGAGSGALCRRTWVGALLLGALLGGCGFKLRGAHTFGFNRIAINPNPGGSVTQELRTALNAQVRVIDAQTPLTQAQVLVDILSEQREKTVVGVNASGQVREFQLRIRVNFKVSTPQGQELVAPDSILQQRDISYSETFALAKETEEAQLYRDMQSDIVQQILRRLAALRLPT